MAGTGKDGKETPRDGLNPAHALLGAVRAALAAGVPPAQIVPILDMARKATGGKQAPVWRSCADALEEYTQEARQEAAPPQA